MSELIEEVLMIKKTVVLGVLSSIFVFPLLAGDPTLDRLIGNMSTYDIRLKSKAKQQLYYLCRNGHDDLLHPYLKSENTSERYAAISVAAALNPSDETISLVTANLQSKDPALKRQAARCLGKYKKSSCSESLVAALNGEVMTRVTVMNALGESGKDVGAKELADQLKDTDYKIRFAAANAMFYCRSSGQAEALKEALEVEKAKEASNLLLEDYKERIVALIQGTLLLTGDEVGKELAEGIASKNRWVRDFSIEAFAVAKDLTIVDKSFETMSHKNRHVRLSAAKCLTAIADIKHFPQIIDLLSNEENPAIREELAMALRRLSSHTFGYNGHESKASRDAAEQSWRKWWKNNAYRYGIDAK